MSMFLKTLHHLTSYKTYCFWTSTPLKSILILFANVPNMLKCKTKATNESSTVKLVLKSCQTFQEKEFINKFSLKLVFPQVKTQFSLSQNMFLVVETHLTVTWLWKTWIPENDSAYCVYTGRKRFYKDSLKTTEALKAFYRKNRPFCVV